MKLIARIKDVKLHGLRVLRVIHPADVPRHRNLPDSMIARHIGPRPWSEAYYVDDEGNRVQTYWEC